MMFDFISRTQLEMAGETTPPEHNKSPRGTPNGSSESLPTITVNGDSSGKKPSEGATGAAEPNTITDQTNAPKEFKELTCMEMMDILTRDLVKWQKEFVA